MAQTTTLPATVQAAVPGGMANEALFLLSFVVVFCVALTAQLLFFKWRGWFPGAESEKSLIKGVRAGVYTFLSHLN
ncbi:MAG: hypothetical protein V3V71_06175 [Roseateles sp.]|jgi:light-harvesting complex 1 beta chain|uniref:hypothetical protein n=1 Tax=Roseateles sp. TaxID=1971397 RepID=UPI000F98A8CB|nr:hypothetical protein [Methylibium sp.]MBY0366970.1 hypothetical protein [Burkholderiaceae bacterium]RTL23738.1 MAG: hypothetical protein EKK52_03465 [Burkholderiales bacterium]